MFLQEGVAEELVPQIASEGNARDLLEDLKNTSAVPVSSNDEPYGKRTRRDTAAHK